MFKSLDAALKRRSSTVVEDVEDFVEH